MHSSADPLSQLTQGRRMHSRTDKSDEWDRKQADRKQAEKKCTCYNEHGVIIGLPRDCPVHQREIECFDGPTNLEKWEDYMNQAQNQSQRNINVINSPHPIDLVRHPPHYTSHPSGVECIEITRHFSYNRGSAIAYIWRAGKKSSASEVEDLRKAVEHLQDEIRLLEKKNP